MRWGDFYFLSGVQLDAITAWYIHISTSISTMHWNGHRARGRVQLCAELALSAIAPQRSKRQAQKKIIVVVRRAQSASLIHWRLFPCWRRIIYSRFAWWKLKAADQGLFNIEWTTAVLCSQLDNILWARRWNIAERSFTFQSINNFFIIFNFKKSMLLLHKFEGFNQFLLNGSNILEPKPDHGGIKYVLFL